MTAAALDRFRGSGWEPAVRDSLAAFLMTRVLIVILFVVGAAVVPAKNAERIALSRPDFSTLLSQGDGGWYLDIARNGYDPGPFTSDTQKNWAFFPLYPIAMKALTAVGVVEDPALGGILLSNLCAIGALVFVWKLAEESEDPSTARRTVFYISAFPTSIFLSAVSNMAMSLLLFTASLYWISRQRYALASLAGGLGVLARGQAIYLMLPLAFSLYKSRTSWLSRLKMGLYLLPMPAALGGFMLYMWDRTGNAFATVDILDAWDRDFAPVWDPIIDFLKDPVMVGYYGWDLAPVNVGVAVLAISLLPFVFRRFRTVIGLYSVVMVFGAVSYSTLQAADRYVLLATPLFMLLAVWGRREWVDRCITTAFLGMLGLWATLFAAGYYPVLA